MATSTLPAGLLDLIEFSRRDLSGYMRVNQTFAVELGKLLQPDDVVWVHDYHLFPLGKALRDRGHRNKIGFFHHIPFPPPELLTALHDAMFQVLLANNVKLWGERFLINLTRPRISRFGLHK